ncbi:polymer-forming cytoskeletal protein [Novosphingobium sp. 9]|uniref:bactofilin family protein n=1 Tax=Novosphingobium sp. 9 TaxID=2025349 RepID=UPI0021B6A376|nr:polymer-forming cytoskeletal protein [Novosphingobium sp. 9]
MPRPHIAPRSGMASTFSILSPDVSVKGDVNASADLHVDGRVEGDITCQGLVQGEGSEITGAIKAKTARISGTVKGTITAREVVILKTARIVGDVHYDALTIEQGAQIDGRLSPSGGDLAPSITAKPPLAIAAQ